MHVPVHVMVVAVLTLVFVQGAFEHEVLAGCLATHHIGDVCATLLVRFILHFLRRGAAYGQQCRLPTGAQAKHERRPLKSNLIFGRFQAVGVSLSSGRGESQLITLVALAVFCDTGTEERDVQRRTSPTSPRLSFRRFHVMREIPHTRNPCSTLFIHDEQHSTIFVMRCRNAVYETASSTFFFTP